MKLPNTWYARGHGQFHQTGLNDIRRSAQRAADVTGNDQFIAIEMTDDEDTEGKRVMLQEGKLWRIEVINPDPVRSPAVRGL